MTVHPAVLIEREPRGGILNRRRRRRLSVLTLFGSPPATLSKTVEGHTTRYFVYSRMQCRGVLLILDIIFLRETLCRIEFYIHCRIAIVKNGSMSTELFAAVIYACETGLFLMWDILVVKNLICIVAGSCQWLRP